MGELPRLLADDASADLSLPRRLPTGTRRLPVDRAAVFGGARCCDAVRILRVRRPWPLRRIRGPMAYVRLAAGVGQRVCRSESGTPPGRLLGRGCLRTGPEPLLASTGRSGWTPAGPLPTAKAPTQA